jgi:putative copper export protein
MIKIILYLMIGFIFGLIYLFFTRNVTGQLKIEKRTSMFGVIILFYPLVIIHVFYKKIIKLLMKN